MILKKRLVNKVDKNQILQLEKESNKKYQICMIKIKHDYNEIQMLKLGKIMI
jgi:hypothetical protein